MYIFGEPYYSSQIVVLKGGLNKRDIIIATKQNPLKFHFPTNIYHINDKGLYTCTNKAHGG